MDREGQAATQGHEDLVNHRRPQDRRDDLQRTAAVRAQFEAGFKEVLAHIRTKPINGPAPKRPSISDWNWPVPACRAWVEKQSFTRLAEFSDGVVVNPTPPASMSVAA